MKKLLIKKELFFYENYNEYRQTRKKTCNWCYSSSVSSIKDGEGIEFIDEESTAYFTDPKGELWQFEKIYILPEDYVPVRQDMHYNSSYGIRIEKYKGDPEDIHFISEYKEMSKRITGNFTFEGEECEYNLVSPEYSYSTYIKNGCKNRANYQGKHKFI